MNRYTIILSLLFVLLPVSSTASDSEPIKTGSVIFIHPDGTGLATWHALRVLTQGPDGELNWDRLPSIGLYKSHVKNSLCPSSHAGATIHAYGVKVDLDTYGSPGGTVVSRSGVPNSILHEAMDAKMPTGIVNSGAIFEPGSAVFAVSDESRSHQQAIAKKVVQSGVDVILSGGEKWLLPQDVVGHHGKGCRTDGLNLITWAKENGYHVMYTAADLNTIPPDAKKLFGVFAAGHTFNDKSEEILIEKGLPNYSANAPTLAQMTKTATEFLAKKGRQFLLVIEEEGTDNFGNRNNANGMLEALKRADDAIGVAQKFLETHPDTLLVTASDSEAGGIELLGFPKSKMNPDANLPARDPNGAPVDGRQGTGTKPFLSEPDQFGNRHPFGLAWSTGFDTYGSVIARSDGLHAERLTGTIDNTEIYRVMYLTLFGKWLK